MKENIHKIFENWNETIIWSCLQGIMGEVHTNSVEDTAMAIFEYSCAMKSHFRKFGNRMSGSGNHLCNYASLLA